MYKLFIQFEDGTQFSNMFTELGLRAVLKLKVKTRVKWATVTTPSSTTKDVTRFLEWK